MSLESLYGTKAPRFPFSPRALMQLPSASRERLMFAPSCSRAPRFFVAAARSEPSAGRAMRRCGGASMQIEALRQAQGAAAKVSAVGRGAEDQRVQDLVTGLAWHTAHRKTLQPTTRRDVRYHEEGRGGLGAPPARSTRLNLPILILATVPSARSLFSTTTCARP